MYHSFQNINGYFYILTNYSENLYGFSIQRNKYSIIKLYSCIFWNVNIQYRYTIYRESIYQKAMYRR
ncbi:hypothetical protein CBR56_11660 [Bacillus thuringiensis]|nr:hypothetical protein BK728_06155 [Bacillus thuringiensis serovar chanpaisis]PNK29740.1 hypothetical protein CBR56_11660 [Bacillus thuringiensis]